LRAGDAVPEATETPPPRQELEGTKPERVSEAAGPEELEIEEELSREELPTVDRQPSAEEVESQKSEADDSVADDAVVLIPFQNTALKDIKRTLVELQNDALEHIRTDGTWVPKKSFTNKFKAPFAELAKNIADDKDDGGAAKEFGADLFDAMTGALTKARESGAGDRQVASSVSRVFRMWRADEAERRVVDAAQKLRL
jgi:hypothetical protein